MMISRKRKEDGQICRKESNGEFKCPSNKPASVVLAIPWYPKSHPSLLIEPSGNNFGEKLDRKLILVQSFKKFEFKIRAQV